jgi:hypothetical protein
VGRGHSRGIKGLEGPAGAGEKGQEGRLEAVTSSLLCPSPQPCHIPHLVLTSLFSYLGQKHG